MQSPGAAQLYEQALALHKRGLVSEAEAGYRQVLAAEPSRADAMHMLGMALDQQGRIAEALDALTHAAQMQPNVAEFHYNFGLVLRRAGRLEQAITEYRTAISLRRTYYEAHKNLGNLLTACGRFSEAEAAFAAALALRPDSAEAHLNLGRSLFRARKPRLAIASYERAIAIKPNIVDAYSDLGLALREIGQIDASIARIREGLAIDPNHVALNSNLGAALRDLGELDEAIAALRTASAKHSDARVAGNLLYLLLFHADYDLARLFDEHRRWNEIYARPLHPGTPVFPNSRHPERKLRLGLVSPQFRDVWFILPLLKHLDPTQFEVYCYDNVGFRASPSVLAPYADHWISTAGLSDDQLAQRIRDDAIDILVDLALHTDGNRLLVFARKPAPVQVTWLGYPGTSGMGAMDYRISDPYLDPVDTSYSPVPDMSGGGLGSESAAIAQAGIPNSRENPIHNPPPGYRQREMRDQFYSEKTIRLPHSFWCYTPLGNEPEVNALPADKNGFITFGCLNSFVKVDEPTLNLWARVLNAVPQSRMKLLAPDGSVRDRVLARFAANDIDAARIDFISQQSREGYLRTFNDFDISLDPFPCTGHTTTIESLWMGVPVVSLAGQTPFSRASLSILSNIGLSELVSFDQDQYVEIAVARAEDRQRLRTMRSTLRRRIEQSPVMDAPRFSAEMQAVFRTIWRTWCASFLQDG